MNSRSAPAAPDAVTAAAGEGGRGLSARVSPHDRKAGLVRQAARLAARAGQAGQPAARIGAEAGSGRGGARSKVRLRLAAPRARAVAAGHRGRPGRVNIGLAGAALPAHGRRLAVPGPASPEVSG